MYLFMWLERAEPCHRYYLSHHTITKSGLKYVIHPRTWGTE